MTQDEIIEIAQGCGLVGMRPHLDGIYIESLVAFAKLVTEAEREICAKVCDDHIDGTPEWNSAANNCATAIRARGKA